MGNSRGMAEMLMPPGIWRLLDPDSVYQIFKYEKQAGEIT